MEEWYYVRDGKQQGPVRLENLRDMAAAGELKPDDKVWCRSMTDWTPAREVDGILPTGPANQADESLDEGETGADSSSTGEIEPGSEPIDVGPIVSRSFQLTKSNFGPLLGVVVLIILINLAVFMIMAEIDRNLGWSKEQTIKLWEYTFTYTEYSWFHQAVTQIFSIFLNLGFLRVALNIIDGKPFRVGQVFSGGPLMVTAVLASLIYFVMVFVGSMFFIIPGIYFALRFAPFMPAIVDRKLGVIESLTYAYQLTHRNTLNLILLAIASLLLMLAGLLLFGVGLLFAWPLVFLSWVLAYRWMQYGRKVTREPKS